MDLLKKIVKPQDPLCLSLMYLVGSDERIGINQTKTDEISPGDKHIGRRESGVLSNWQIVNDSTIDHDLMIFIRVKVHLYLSTMGRVSERQRSGKLTWDSAQQENQ
jgi:hypothetical protein